MTLSDFELFIFDMDGVLTEDSSSWNYVHKRFHVDNHELRQRFESGQITYSEFLSGDVSLWINKKGRIQKSEIVSILQEIPMTAGVVQAINTLKDKGKKVAIVSGGISWLADIIEKSVKFDSVNSNHILTDDKGYIIPDGVMEVDFKHKDKNVRQLQQLYSIPKEMTVCVGDSFDDKSLFMEAGYSIAFNPRHPELASYSDVVINSHDLMSIVNAVDQLR